MTTEGTSTKNKIQVLGILIILIGFPLLSWYYLKSGYDYQMDARSELKDYGKIPAFSFKDLDGSDYSNNSLGDTLSVFSFLGKEENINEEIFKVMGKLNTQFGDNRNLKLLLVALDEKEFQPSGLDDLFQKYKLDSRQHFMLSSPNGSIQNWLGQKIKVPTQWIEKENEAAEIIFESNASGTLSDYPFFILMDRKQMIRNFYHVDQVNEVKRMVEHIALLLPRDVKPDAIYQPEKEK